jgi:hypothetical protein
VILSVSLTLLRLHHTYIVKVFNDDPAKSGKDEDDDGEDDDSEIDTSAPIVVTQKETADTVLPPRADADTVPAVEWWDEPYLSRENREIRKRVAKLGASSSGSSGDSDLFSTASIVHSRSHM